MGWRIANLYGFKKRYEIISDAVFFNAMKSWANTHIYENGSYDQDINDVFPVSLIIWLYQVTGEESYKKFISEMTI